MAPQQIGRYHILREVGRGGMATVYHAHDPHFKRDVAVKVLPRQFTHDPMFRARFEREAQTIAALEYPSIVPVYDFGEQDEQPYLVMRYMTGGSLAERIQQGPLTVEEAIRIVTKLAPALDEAHRRGIIHRDLKPGNILFDTQGRPYLADFGIAKLIESTSSFTGSAVLGTPAYMSPEQAKGGQVIDGRADIYALGVILFEMLAGRAPYQADTPVQVLMKHILEPVPAILQVRPELPPNIDAVITQALAKDVHERYPSAKDMVRALTGATRLPPPTVPPQRHSAARQSTAPKSTTPKSTASKPASPRSATPKSATRRPSAPAASPSRTPSKSGRRSLPPWSWLAGITVLALLYIGFLLSRGVKAPSAPEATATSSTLLVVASTVTATVPEPSATITSTATVPASPTSSATHTVVPIATALPQLRVTADSVNLREGPGTNYRIVGVLQQGDTVMVLAKTSNGTWYNVVLDDGRAAWLAASVSEPVDPAVMSSVSVAVTIPPRPLAIPIPSPTPTATPPPPPAEPPTTQAPTQTPTEPPTQTPTEPPPTDTTDTPEPPPDTETPCSYPACP